ncbi:hypothetical protein FRB94_005331 [Tulasnella sp. JGI-2019a]|nr:hypothetical protein FRB94_005331 [Tulasnella sp. JGI-2019a]KAG9030015.1 hypothetical protein FRB95_004661 [Tulasnella sp. JGI-2019a]
MDRSLLCRNADRRPYTAMPGDGMAQGSAALQLSQIETRFYDHDAERQVNIDGPQLYEDILSLVVLHASTSLLYKICFVSRSVKRAAQPLLYEDIVITREEQYRLLLSRHAFPIIRGDEEAIANTKYADNRYVVPDWYEVGKNSLLKDNIRSLTLLTPPPKSFIEDMAADHPFLATSKYRLRPVELGPGGDDPEFGRDTADQWGPISLDSVCIHTGEKEYGLFAPASHFFSPFRFSIVSTDPVASMWINNDEVIQEHWSQLEEINFVDCFVLRTDDYQAGPYEGIAIPGFCSPMLRIVTVTVQKHDHKTKGILNTVVWEIPGRDEWKRFELFEVRVTGEARARSLEERREKAKVGWHKWESDVNPVRTEMMTVVLLPGEEGAEPGD